MKALQEEALATRREVFKKGRLRMLQQLACIKTVVDVAPVPALAPVAALSLLPASASALVPFVIKSF